MKRFSSTLPVLATFVTCMAASPLPAAAATPAPPTCSGPQDPPTAPPSQAAAAGFNNLVFDDEFNSAATISPNHSGSYNWYLSPGMTSSDYTVSNGCLTILTDFSGYGDDLSTIASSSSKTGTYQTGYFEARMQFNPTGSQGGAWPAFWSFAMQAFQRASPIAELDFMEAYPHGRGGATAGNNGVTMLTTIHQWTASATAETGSNVQNADVTPIPPGFNYDAFHIYGCLWTTNKIVWYLDNQPVMTVAIGPGTNFTAIQKDNMYVILGTGKNWPTTVDYVHIWGPPPTPVAGAN